MSDKSEFRVIIAGSRTFDNYELLATSCDRLLKEKQQSHTVVVISGTARGADRLGERYAHERGYAIERYPADWKRNGKAAGPIRNAQMAENADALIAFWDGISKGTQNMIKLAGEKGLKVRIVKY